MTRDERFTFLCTKEEKYLLSKIAEQMERSKGSTVRVLIYGAAEKLGISRQKVKINKLSNQGGKDE